MIPQLFRNMLRGVTELTATAGMALNARRRAVLYLIGSEIAKLVTVVRKAHVKLD
ncbi:hypothetical protein [Cupriavidus basilensis]|uniref:hypothetical protein n=1 Tax=Cupriavidus basilensis TaxID=68895 RepID=UPI00157A8CAD|nr:hypothetical protein [Cupriavidus basilensis]